MVMGSLRLQTPLAPAIHLGADKLLVISVRYKRTPEEEILAQVKGYPPPAQVIGMVLNAVFLDALETDLERVRRINHTLSLLPSEKRPATGLKRIELLVLRPSRDLGKLAADIKADIPGLLKVIRARFGDALFKDPRLSQLSVIRTDLCEKTDGAWIPGHAPQATGNRAVPGD